MRTNQIRTQLSVNLELAEAGLTLMFAKVCATGEMFAAMNLEWNAWRVDGGPVPFDLFAISYPLDFDASTIGGADDEAAAIAHLNAQLTATKVYQTLELHLLPDLEEKDALGQDDNYNAGAPQLQQSGVQDYFRHDSPRRVHWKSHECIRVVNATKYAKSSSDATPTVTAFLHTGGVMRARKNFRYRRPSMFVICARILNTNVVGNDGPPASDRIMTTDGEGLESQQWIAMMDRKMHREWSTDAQYSQPGDDDDNDLHDLLVPWIRNDNTTAASNDKGAIIDQSSTNNCSFFAFGNIYFRTPNAAAMRRL